MAQAYDLVIIGGGPAGLTGALYAGRGMLRTVLLERGVTGGELLNTDTLDDVPGFPLIKGYELAQRFADHAREFGAEFREGCEVATVQRRSDGRFVTTTVDGEEFCSPAVLLTTGGVPLKLGVPGEAEFAGKGVSYCAVCDGHFYRGHTIAVVGGGDSACEEADYLTRYAEKVYLLVRRDEFMASRSLQQRVFSNPKIEVRWNTVVTEISDYGSETGLVNMLELRDTRDATYSILKVTGVFVFIGFRPNTGVLGDLGEHVEHDAAGYIRTGPDMMSSVPGLFVAGDVRSQLVRQVTTAAGDATTAAIAVDRYLKARATFTG